MSFLFWNSQETVSDFCFYCQWYLSFYCPHVSGQQIQLETASYTWWTKCWLPINHGWLQCAAQKIRRFWSISDQIFTDLVENSDHLYAGTTSQDLDWSDWTDLWRSLCSFAVSDMNFSKDPTGTCWNIPGFTVGGLWRCITNLSQDESRKILRKCNVQNVSYFIHSNLLAHDVSKITNQRIEMTSRNDLVANTELPRTWHRQRCELPGSSHQPRDASDPGEGKKPSILTYGWLLKPNVNNVAENLRTTILKAFWFQLCPIKL